MTYSKTTYKADDKLQAHIMNPQDELPLTEAVFFILLSLTPGPKHGYAIMKNVQLLSDGRLSLSTGTLYGALKRLLDAGWVIRVEGNLHNENGRERKSYALTSLGKNILEAETTRLQNLVEIARLRSAGKETA
jgi:DNA-binding PadR family transcriptional regulator